jgi:hypothetical protein
VAGCVLTLLVVVAGAAVAVPTADGVQASGDAPGTVGTGPVTASATAHLPTPRAARGPSATAGVGAAGHPRPAAARAGATSRLDQAAEYRLRFADAVAVPERTVTLEGTDYTVSRIARAPPDASRLTVDVSSPPDEIYRVYLYDADRRIVASARGQGPGAARLAVDGLAPGTYLAMVQHRGVAQVVRPVVLQGYDLRATAPATAATGRSIRVVAAVTPGLAAGHDAAVVIGNGTTTRRVNATPTDGRLVATVETGGLAAGSYRAYALVQGTETTRGRRELLAVAGAGNVSLTAEATGSDTAAGPATPARTPGVGTEAGDDGPEGDGGEADTTATATTAGDGDDGDGGGSVITPASTTRTAPATDPDDGSAAWLDGFALPGSLAGVSLAVALLVAWRLRGRDRDRDRDRGRD